MAGGVFNKGGNDKFMVMPVIECSFSFSEVYVSPLSNRDGRAALASDFVIVIFIKVGSCPKLVDVAPAIRNSFSGNPCKTVGVRILAGQHDTA
jgi:hypothetical protein